MTYNPLIHRRRSIRLFGFDYSQPGCYFITICVHEKKCILGKIINNKVVLNNLGQVIEDEWLNTEKIRRNIKIDKFVVMPNHVHGIIVIKADNQGVWPYHNENSCRGVWQYAPTDELNTINNFDSPSQSIGSIIRGFKSITTKKINIIRQTSKTPVWQRNYYEHIIRDENDYLRIVNYIQNNPDKWQFDGNYKT
ncbi:MAG: transposase [Candidatus Buchananbacteria bacterium]